MGRYRNALLCMFLACMLGILPLNIAYGDSLSDKQEKAKRSRRSSRPTSRNSTG